MASRAFASGMYVSLTLFSIPATSNSSAHSSSGAAAIKLASSALIPVSERSTTGRSHIGLSSIFGPTSAVFEFTNSQGPCVCFAFISFSKKCRPTQRCSGPQPAAPSGPLTFALVPFATLGVRLYQVRKHSQPAQVSLLAQPARDAPQAQLLLNPHALGDVEDLQNLPLYICHADQRPVNL